MTEVSHRQIVPVFTRGLQNSALFLRKGVNALSTSASDELNVLGTQLAPDMFPLSRQIQIAADHAKGATARLAGVEVPTFADDERSLVELLDRIDRTCSYVASFGPEAFLSAGDRRITLRMGGSELSFSGADYLYEFALPNFYFHLTTAYGILRSLGAALGKRDFLGARPAPHK